MNLVHLQENKSLEYTVEIHHNTQKSGEGFVIYVSDFESISKNANNKNKHYEYYRIMHFRKYTLNMNSFDKRCWNFVTQVHKLGNALINI